MRCCQGQKVVSSRVISSQSDGSLQSGLGLVGKKMDLQDNPLDEVRQLPLRPARLQLGQQFLGVLRLL